MEAQVGTEALRKSGTNNPTDLIKFPWDNEPSPALTDKDRNEMQAEMAAENAWIRKQNEKDEST